MTSALRIEYAIHFCRRGRGATKEMALGAEQVRDVPPRLPRLARLMALAIRLERLVRTGTIKDCATLARLGQVSRARVSQIMSLSQLAPDLQEALLFLPPLPRGQSVCLGELLPIAALADWSKQRQRWRALSAARKRRAGSR